MKLNKSTFTTALLCFFITFSSFAQCVITIADDQPYFEGFESGTMECWTVETTGGGNWAVMTGTGSNVVAFSQTNVGDEARLISPTFDMSEIGGATFSFSYAMMGLYDNDELVVSYRTSEADPWHDLGSYSLNDWTNTYEETFALTDLTSTYQISFLGRANGGYYIFIDNIEIASSGSCARPVSLEATDITPFSALLEWSTTGNETSWTLDFNGHQMTVEDQPYLMENLEPNTDYTFMVKANCDNGMESSWSLPTTFKTSCDVIVVTDDMPYFDDFEASDEFVCWQDLIISGDGGWVVDPGYLILNNTAFFIWLNEDAMLISAPLDISSVTNPMLEFKHKQRAISNQVDYLFVGYRTSPTEEWTMLGTYTDAAEDWETVTLELPEASTMYQIGFEAFSNGADGVYVDDVFVGSSIQAVHDTPTVTVNVNPNPTTGKVVVTSNISEGEVVVFDLMGRQVAFGEVTKGRVELDLSGLVQGVYVTRITGEAGTSTVKLVKE